MKMLYCRKCGAAMFTDEGLAQSIMDKATEMSEAAKHVPGRYKAALLQEAAGYRSMYKALMHNITKKEYAETVTPIILKLLTDEIKKRQLMTDEEISTICDRGKAIAQMQKRDAEKEEKRIYGEFEAACNRSHADPTADAAIARVDKEIKRRRLR